MMWRHMLKLWPRYTLAPMLPFWGWAIYFALRYQFRWDQFAWRFLVTALAYGNSWTKRLFIGLLPIGLVGAFLRRDARREERRAHSGQRARLRSSQRRTYLVRRSP